MTFAVSIRIDAIVREHFSQPGAWSMVPVHALMVSGAQQALYAIIHALMDEDLARIKRGQRPRHQDLVARLQAEVDALLAAEQARAERERQAVSR